MEKKWIIAVVIIAVVLLAVAVLYLGDNPTDNSGEKKSFNVSSGSYGLNEVIKDIKTNPYYEGYDKETVKWMESLGNKKVFFGNDSIVIMDNLDALRIPGNPDITDVYIFNHFSAKVVEKHDLCEKYPKVYYVKNVNFIEQEIVSNGLA